MSSGQLAGTTTGGMSNNQLGKTTTGFSLVMLKPKMEKSTLEFGF